jgi:putative peptide maturation system protein
MADPLTPALCAALDYLKALNRDGVRPPEARARLQGLRGRHPEARLDLLWEEEACDYSVHYDALLYRDGEGTVSLSYCPERTLPWPLRGVQRWSEMNLVRVNATVLKVDQAVALLDFAWGDAPMLKRLVHAAIVREALERDPVTVSDADMQRALDGFRRVHRLVKAADMRRWMAERGLTQEKLEGLVAEMAQLAALRGRVTAGRVEEYFAAHRADFDAASVAQFAVPDAEQAQRIVDEIRAGTVDFYSAAERSFLDGGPTAGDLFATVRRGKVSAELAAALDAEPGDVVGPLRRGDAHVIVRVLSKTPARLDGPARAAVQDALFEAWLEERRAAAAIEWYWGPADDATGRS